MLSQLIAGEIKHVLCDFSERDPWSCDFFPQGFGKDSQFFGYLGATEASGFENNWTAWLSYSM